MPAREPANDSWNAWHHPTAVDWANPAADPWDAPAADAWGPSGTSPWAAQPRDSWSNVDELSPFNTSSFFIDRWAAHAVGALVPFWARGVAAAEAGQQPAKFTDFLDEMERSDAGRRIWHGVPDVPDSWGVALNHGEDEARKGSSEQSWGSHLRSRPRTPSLKGQDRERSRKQKTARLEQKGIYWPDADSANKPNIKNFMPTKKLKDTGPNPVFIIEDGREWVEDVIAKTCSDSRAAKRLRVFWEVSTTATVNPALSG